MEPEFLGLAFPSFGEEPETEMAEPEHETDTASVAEQEDDSWFHFSWIGNWFQGLFRSEKKPAEEAKTVTFTKGKKGKKGKKKPAEAASVAPAPKPAETPAPAGAK